MPGQFTNRKRAQRVCDDNPHAFLDALEHVLNQKQIDQIETILFPPATVSQKRKELEKAIYALRCADFADDHPKVIGLRQEIDKLESAEPNPLSSA